VGLLAGVKVLLRKGRFKKAYEISRPSFVFYSSRMPSIFKAALEPLGGREYKPEDDHIDLLYTTKLDEDTADTNSIGVSLMKRRTTSTLDNKAKCAKALASLGINKPRTYFKVEDVPNEPDTMWYIKDPVGTGGVGICLVPQKEVASHFTDGYVIQEAVRDIALLDGKKFTLRLYVLIHEGCFYLFQDGLVVLHGAVYDSESADPKVQYIHAGYMDLEPDVKISTFSDTHFYEEALVNIKEGLGQIFQGLKRYTPYEQVNAYCLLGVDLLLTPDMQPVLIEINDRPNFKHTQLVNARVNVPAIQAMYSILNFGSQTNLLGDAKKFEPLQV
jgi:prolyl 4-hydroxylase